MATSWYSSLSPVNAFPPYHGPYAVGTVDVEIPASDLPSPCETPQDAQSTIAFRMFYPCAKPSHAEVDRPVRWIPQPQRLTVAALLNFLGLRDRWAGALSYFTQQLYWIRIQAHRNAKLLDPPISNGRWPVTMFSHGLAGSRNAYSYTCGDLASNGMIVIALDHRDGSSPVQYVRVTKDTDARIIHPIKISHNPSNEVYEARDKQLRIRLWETSMAYEALMKIDAGEKIENLDGNTSRKRKERIEVLQRFDQKLDIHRPGKVSFCGHSFGATTVTQLLKSVYYANDRPHHVGSPLISPRVDAAILHQISPDSPTLLLDMWGLPLQSPDQAFLWDRPLPSYAVDGPEGDNVLAVLSESFNNWKGNLDINKHIVAAPSSSGRPSSSPRDRGRVLPVWARLRDQSPSQDSGYGSQDSQPPARSPTRHANPFRPTQKSQGPHVFYTERSQHFNHSDFGILFPWLTRRIAKADDPEKILELNTRAIVQVLREAGIEVAGKNDEEILDTESSIRRWISIPVGDESKAKKSGTLDAVSRRLSSTSSKSAVAAAPVDEVPMGQNTPVRLET